MERIPKPGEFYRHFKNRLYQVIAVARHTETEELMVVYQALYGDFGVYVRPLQLFAGEVDQEKYPDAGQKYRFERVEPGKDGPERDEPGRDKSGRDESGKDEPAACEICGAADPSGASAYTVYTESPEVSQAPNPYLLAFLDAASASDKMEALRRMKGGIGQRELDSIYEVLDLRPSPGSVEEQLQAVERYLETQQKYDGTRLR